VFGITLCTIAWSLEGFDFGQMMCLISWIIEWCCVRSDVY
jgi:hypothetical protein